MPSANDEIPKMTRRPPAKNPDDREKQLISYAVDLAESQLLKGTASAQVITHYLKLATQREALEQERLRLENELARARTNQIEAQGDVRELYENAIKAMNSYKPSREVTDD